MGREYQNPREFATIQSIDGPTGGSCLRWDDAIVGATRRLLNFSCPESILGGGAADSGLSGFSHPWRYEEEGKARVAQVERQGCELILSSQWPDKVGKGLIFISLDVEVIDALRGVGRKGRGRERWALGLQAHGHSGPRWQRALLSLPVGRKGNMN